MDTKRYFYICPVCFEVHEAFHTCHGHPMVYCDAGEPGSDRHKPVTDSAGGWYPPRRVGF